MIPYKHYQPVNGTSYTNLPMYKNLVVPSKPLPGL